MSWLARSIANSLHLEDAEDEYDAVPRSLTKDAGPSELLPPETNTLPAEDQNRVSYNSDDDEDQIQGRGVKEDLSELKDSFTRQFWGVASYLAPPPPPPPPLPHCQKSNSVYHESEPDRNASENEGDELDELVDSSESEDCNTNPTEEAVGITEEVLTFAMNIAHHPETWLDFPLSEEDEFDDFDISDAQYKHALVVEHLSPRLAALRNELCPAHMSEGYFWMVYFVLLHSRLNKHDADLLSSPQLAQARSRWMQELQKQTKEDPHWLSTSILHAKRSAQSSPRDNFATHSNENSPHIGNMSDRISPFESTMHHHMTAEFVDKSVIKEDPLPKLEEKQMIMGPPTPRYDNDGGDDSDDDWLKEDEDLIGLTGTSIMVNEEDISFSDLEDDFDCTMPVKTKTAPTEWNVSTKT